MPQEHHHSDNPPAAPTTAAQQRELREILEQLNTLSFCLPGSIQQRHIRCQNPRCRCHSDPPQLHGPYLTWTRKVAGKTVTRNLTPQQAERYSRWFADNRRLRQLTSALQTLSLRAANDAEGWGEK